MNLSGQYCTFSVLKLRLRGKFLIWKNSATICPKNDRTRQNNLTWCTVPPSSDGSLFVFASFLWLESENFSLKNDCIRDTHTHTQLVAVAIISFQYDTLHRNQDIFEMRKAMLFAKMAFFDWSKVPGNTNCVGSPDRPASSSYFF